MEATYLVPVFDKGACLRSFSEGIVDCLEEACIRSVEKILKRIIKTKGLCGRVLHIRSAA